MPGEICVARGIVIERLIVRGVQIHDSSIFKHFPQESPAELRAWWIMLLAAFVLALSGEHSGAHSCMDERRSPESHCYRLCSR